MKRSAYLDYNATAPLRAGVADVVNDALTAGGNPSSVHTVGREARRRIEDARDRVAKLTGARADQIVFTSGGTEANNLALKGCGRGRILASAVEHVSVLDAVPGIERVPVDGNGIVDLDQLANMLHAGAENALVSIMLVNNETGVIEPVAEAVKIAHDAGALVHCDAVQGAGRLAIDFAALGVDLMSLSAHKIGGPQGVGALIVGDAVRLAAQISGGGQERGLRAGTEGVAAIAGFGVAAERALEDLAMPDEAWIAHAWDLRDQLEARVLEMSPESRIFGADADRVANTSCLTLPGVASETQVMALDLEGVMVSAGAACSSGKVGPSHVLAAMGVGDDVASTAIRISLGWDTTQEDIDTFVEARQKLAVRVGDIESNARTAA